MYSNVDERIKRSFQILNQFRVVFPFPDDASQFSVHLNISYQKLSQNDSATDEIKKLGLLRDCSETDTQKRSISRPI